MQGRYTMLRCFSKAFMSDCVTLQKRLIRIILITYVLRRGAAQDEYPTRSRVAFLSCEDEAGHVRDCHNLVLSGG